MLYVACVERVWCSKDHPLSSVSVEIQANICVYRELQQLPRPHSLLAVYFRHSSDINEHTYTLHTHLQAQEHETVCVILEWRSDVGCVLRWVCVCLIVWTPQFQTVLVKETGTVASGEMDGLGDQCEGCEGSGKGRRGGGRGVSQHAAPLGRRAMTSKALPPSYSLQRNMLLRWRETERESQTFITRECHISGKGPEENTPAWLLFIRPHLLGQFYQTFYSFTTGANEFPFIHFLGGHALKSVFGSKPLKKTISSNAELRLWLIWFRKSKTKCNPHILLWAFEKTARGKYLT